VTFLWKARRDEGSTVGRITCETRTRPHAPGSWRVESILIVAPGAPLRGGRRAGDLACRRRADGLPAIRSHDRAGRPRVLDPARRRGASTPSRHVRGGHPRYLRSAWIAPQTHTVTVSTVLGATDGGLVTSLRTRRSRRAVTFEVKPSRRLVLRAGDVDGASWLAACSGLHGSVLSHVAPPRGGREKRRTTQRHGRRRPHAGAGEDRTLEVMLARRGRCRSRQTESGVEKRALSISPDLEAFADGRLARSLPYESTRRRVK
jgi:hypothetical protein